MYCRNTYTRFQPKIPTQTITYKYMKYKKYSSFLTFTWSIISDQNVHLESTTSLLKNTFRWICISITATNRIGCILSITVKVTTTFEIVQICFQFTFSSKLTCFISTSFWRPFRREKYWKKERKKNRVIAFLIVFKKYPGLYINTCVSRNVIVCTFLRVFRCMSM